MSELTAADRARPRGATLRTQGQPIAEVVLAMRRGKAADYVVDRVMRGRHESEPAYDTPIDPERLEEIQWNLARFADAMFAPEKAEE